jgi:hypothetical protein
MNASGLHCTRTGSLPSSFHGPTVDRGCGAGLSTLLTPVTGLNTAMSSTSSALELQSHKLSQLSHKLSGLQQDVSAVKDTLYGGATSAADSAANQSSTGASVRAATRKQKKTEGCALHRFLVLVSTDTAGCSRAGAPTRDVLLGPCVDRSSCPSWRTWSGQSQIPLPP